MRRIRLGLVVAALAAAAYAGDEIPFPIRKSTTASRAGATYFVEGHQRIGKGVTINCKQGIRIEGRGENPTLEIEGTLIIEGQPNQEVLIENLRIVPAAKFHIIRIEWVRMQSGSIETQQGGAEGRFSLDSTAVVAPVELAFRDGTIRILSSEFRRKVKLEGVVPDGKSRSGVKVEINHCSGGEKQIELRAGFYAGLHIARVPDLLVRGCWLTGGNYEFEDCRKLMFDGNTLVSANTLSFRQSSAGGFSGTRVTKCDFHGGKIVFHAPTGPKRDKVIMDKCWFGGARKPEEILGKIVHDGTGNEECGVEVQLRKTNARPLGIGGLPK